MWCFNRQMHFMHFDTWLLLWHNLYEVFLSIQNNTYIVTLYNQIQLFLRLWNFILSSPRTTRILLIPVLQQFYQELYPNMFFIQELGYSFVKHIIWLYTYRTYDLGIVQYITTIYTKFKTWINSQGPTSKKHLSRLVLFWTLFDFNPGIILTKCY